MPPSRAPVVCTSAFPNRFFHFLFTYTPTTEIYTLSLHDALPIYKAGRRTARGQERRVRHQSAETHCGLKTTSLQIDRKSTRLNSSHEWISYAVFCLKKKNSNVHDSHTPY